MEGLIIPVPKKYADFNSENRPEKLPKYLAIASSKFYCKKRGFGE
jgi:CRISPR-associated endonuclease/helicase Cas3